MPPSDGAGREALYILAGLGLLLIVLSLVIRYRLATRGSFRNHMTGVAGGLMLGVAGGLYFVPPAPDWFSRASVWYPVERGDIVITAIGPGEVEPTDMTQIVCELEAPAPGAAAGEILWVIDEGETVKKGDLLVRFDDPEWLTQLNDKAIAPERRKFLEEQIARCRILAPRDGVVIYYRLPRSMTASNIVAAQGEQVREGQKLLSIFDPSKMGVRMQTSGPQFAGVRVGQAARVHIDRIPDQTFEGQVSHIAKTPTGNTVEVKLSDPVAGLMPDMSAKVSIDLAHRKNVLHVPAQTLLHSGDKTFCFVKSGRQIEIRVVNLGRSDSQVAEITNGLREGEQVLREAAWMQIPLPAK